MVPARSEIYGAALTLPPPSVQRCCHWLFERSVCCVLGWVVCCHRLWALGFCLPDFMIPPVAFGGRRRAGG